MMKYFISGLVALMMVVAVQAAEPIIIVFDGNEVLGRSKAGQSLQKQLNTQVGKVRGDAEKFFEGLQGEARKLQEQRSLMAPDALQAKFRELQSQELTKQQELREEIGAIQAGGQRSAQDIQKIMGEELKKIAGERKATIILRREVTAFVDPSFDVTSELVNRVDKRITRVTLKPVKQTAENK